MAATLVLIYSPFVGSGCWARVAPLIKSGNTIVTDYAAAFGRAKPYYSAIAGVIAEQISAEPSSDFVLVAHSGAGALVPVVAEKIGARGVIFVDALLPHPGKCWFDTMSPALRDHLLELVRNGRLPPWDRWWPKKFDHDNASGYGGL